MKGIGNFFLSFLCCFMNFFIFISSFLVVVNLIYLNRKGAPLLCPTGTGELFIKILQCNVRILLLFDGVEGGLQVRGEGW